MFTIPNGTAFLRNKAQADIDSVDFTVLGSAIAGTGVVNGCEVIQATPATMTLTVSDGSIVTGGDFKIVAQTNVTIAAANATNPRFDLVVVNSSGTPTSRAGTAAASPICPAPTAGDVVIAFVYIPANATTLDQKNIVDKRVYAKGFCLPNTTAFTTTVNTTEQTIATFTLPKGVLFQPLEYFRASIWGLITKGGFTSSLTLRFKVNGVQVCGAAYSNNLTITDLGISAICDFRIVRLGTNVDGQIAGQSFMRYNTAANTGIWTDLGNSANVSLTLNAAPTVTVTAQWSSTSGNPVVKYRCGYVASLNRNNWE